MGTMSGGAWKLFKKLFGLESEVEVLAELAARHQGERKSAGPTANFSGFHMKVDEIFHVGGRGLLARGTISAGCVKKGEWVTMETGDGERIAVVVQGIERDRRIEGEARAGDTVGVIVSCHLDEGASPPDVRLLRA